MYVHMEPELLCISQEKKKKSFSGLENMPEEDPPGDILKPALVVNQLVLTLTDTTRVFSSLSTLRCPEWNKRPFLMEKLKLTNNTVEVWQ